MANAQYPDGRIEHLVSGATPDVAAKAALAAMLEGAVKATIYVEPHQFVGSKHRCETCFKLPDDAVHGLGSPTTTKDG